MTEAETSAVAEAAAETAAEVAAEVAPEAEADTRMLVEEWMSRDPECVASLTPLSDVAAMMGIRRHSCVVVVDNQKAVGLISERDLVRELSRVLNGQVADATASDAMSAPVVTVDCGQPLDEATRVMASNKIRRLVVVNAEQAIVGIVTQSDLMRAHVESAKQQQQVLEAQVAERTAELESAVEQLETLSRVDPLMGIGNRRAMEESLAIAHQRSLRYQRTYSVILLDVDKFKPYNDTYGHPRGDRVLRDVAREVTACVRMLDRVYRYGGEEILVLLPETGPEGTVAVAERIRHSVAALAIEHRSSEHEILTVSAGIATSVPRGDGSIPGVLDLLAAADRSLYNAKGSGRNRLGPVETPD
ncbi:MAG: diguanylate cyclase [Gammaproteobacteria bacterium]|nr:diguanylate cyclase [Gammaproteobacteria bacterium]